MRAMFGRLTGTLLALGLSLGLGSGIAAAQSKITIAVGGGACLCYLPTVLAQQLGEFDKAVDWGWFEILSKPVFRVMDFYAGYLATIGLGFGWAILALTITIRLVMFPAFNASYAMSTKMKKVQPEMKALQERFKGDPAGQQKEMMALYAREKINPVTGCIPMLLPLPVFFALSKLFTVTIEMRHANFGWVQHIVHHLAPAGVAGFVLANGSMSSNQSGEGEIRKNLIETGIVDCMVALPGQLFYSTQIPACLWFLARDRKNGKFRDRRGYVLFIDARKLGRMVDRTHRELTDEDRRTLALPALMRAEAMTAAPQEPQQHQQSEEMNRNRQPHHESGEREVRDHPCGTRT